MVHQVILPKLGTNMEEGLIAEWCFEEGNAVKKGDVLLLVETSKAVFEVEAETGGYLRKRFGNEGHTVRFTSPVALISDTLDEEIGPHIPGPEKAAKRHHERKREALVEPTAVPAAPRNAVAAGPSPVSPASGAGRVHATPAARRLAEELGVDLAAASAASHGAVIDEDLVRGFAARKRVAVYGAGLGVRQVGEVMRRDDKVDFAGLFDDDPELKGKTIAGRTVLGGFEELAAVASAEGIDAVAVSLHSEHRRKLIEKIRRELPGLELAVLIDPRAVVCGNVTVSPGALVEAGATIGPDTFIGEGSIVDMGATVSHDCHIGAHSHLSPGCVVSGVVRLEENVLVGVGAALNSQITVGRNCVITPGSAVVSDLPADVVVTGNPARIIGKSLRGAG